MTFNNIIIVVLLLNLKTGELEEVMVCFKNDFSVTEL